MTAPILEMHAISKRFDMTQALDKVSLQLFSGETLFDGLPPRKPARHARIHR